jgi:hypothetical protein
MLLENWFADKMTEEITQVALIGHIDPMKIERYRNFINKHRVEDDITEDAKTFQKVKELLSGSE